MHTVTNWPRLFEQCWEMLNQSGWIETNDFLAPYRSWNPAVSLYNSPFLLFGDVAERIRELEIDPRAALRHHDRLRLQGFTNVKTVEICWPLGEWGDKEDHRMMW